MSQEGGKYDHRMTRTSPTKIRSKAVTDRAHEQLISLYSINALLVSKIWPTYIVQRGNKLRTRKI